MALKLSTGAINSILATSSAKSSIEGGAGFLIDIYSGSRPASPDDAASGTKLITVSNNGNGTGLHLATTASAGVIEKLATETWSGVVLVTGTAGWFRIRKTTDTGLLADPTAIRMDGTIATSGADLNLTNTSLVLSEPFVVNSAKLKII